MKYYILNPVLDSQIAEIKQKISLSMNGIVSEQMIQGGINYKKNFGVSIPRLKEIASSYKPQHDLAQRLWDLKIRETMILATLLQPTDTFTPKIAKQWADDFNQIEIVEQCCMNIFCKLSWATEISCNWINSDKLWIQITAFRLAARVFENLSNEEIKSITLRAVELSNTDEFHLYKSIAVCLSRFCRKDRLTAIYVKNLTNFGADSVSVGQQFIKYELTQELLFLEIL